MTTVYCLLLVVFTEKINNWFKRKGLFSFHY